MALTVQDISSCERKAVMSRAIALLLLGLLCLLQPGWASSIHINYLHLGGTRWQASLLVTNPGLSSPVGEFTVFLPAPAYTNLELAASPAGWDMLLVQSDPQLPADGFVDGLVLDPMAALGDGDQLSGIELRFDLIGLSVPDSLRFELFDADFMLLSSGMSSVSFDQGNGTVPEPPALMLVALAISIVVVVRPRTTKPSAQAAA